MTLRTSGKVGRKIHCKGSLLFAKQKNNKMRAIMWPMQARVVNQLAYSEVEMEDRGQRPVRKVFQQSLYSSLKRSWPRVKTAKEEF